LAAALNRLWRPLRHVYLLLVVMIGWVFFRADTLPEALSYLRALAGLGVASPTAFAASFYLTRELVLALAAGVIGSMPVGAAIERWRANHPEPAWMFDAAAVAAFSLILGVSMLEVAAGSYSPFIYFRF
jgi:alginate O-acetyltransferase complex protein AlgI